MIVRYQVFSRSNHVRQGFAPVSVDGIELFVPCISAGSLVSG